MWLKHFLNRRKYELLLVGLVSHLFIAIVVRDLSLYRAFIWPLNMFILGLAGFGVFYEKKPWKRVFQAILFLPVLGLPLGAYHFAHIQAYFMVLSVLYVIFFVFIFVEVISFLIKPGYINIDLLSAAACGYLLLIEISTFLFQFFFLRNRASFKGINTIYNAIIFNDFVYFSSITITSIGYGDIVPTIYYTRLLAALVGIIGHFYTVMLVGIVISKFVSKTDQ